MSDKNKSNLCNANLNIHFRVYDEDYINKVNKILKDNPEEYKSKEELFKKAAEREINKIYDELLYDLEPNKIIVDETEIMAGIDQNFILLNIIMRLVSALYNIEAERLSKNTVECMTKGLYDELPKRFEKFMKNLFAG